MKRFALIPLLVLVAAVCAVAPAGAQGPPAPPESANIQNWDIYAATGGGANGTQNPVAFGAHPTDGTLWFVAQNPALRLGNLNPNAALNNYRQWTLPAGVTGTANGVAVSGNDVWMTVGNKVIAKIRRGNGQEVFRTFTLPAGLGTTLAQRLAVTADGQFAYVPVKADGSGSGPETSIYRIPRGGDTVGATVTATRWLVNSSSNIDDPRHIVIDGAGMVWMANANSRGRIQRLDPTAVPDEFGIPPNVKTWVLPSGQPPFVGLFVINGPGAGTGAAKVCAVMEGQLTSTSGNTTCLDVATNTLSTFVCTNGSSCLELPQELALNAAGDRLAPERGRDHVSFVSQASAVSTFTFNPPASGPSALAILSLNLTSLASVDSAVVTPTTITVTPSAVTTVAAVSAGEPGHVNFPLGVNSHPLGISPASADDGTPGSGTFFIAQSFSDGVNAPIPGAVITKLILGGTPVPAFQVQPTALPFTVLLGGTVPEPSEIAVSRSGGGDPLSWQATLRNHAAWLTLASSPECATPGFTACGSTASPATGLGLAFNQAAVSALAIGTYTEFIDIVDPDGIAAPVSVEVTLSVVRRPVMTLSPTPPAKLHFVAVNTDTVLPGALPVVISSTCPACTPDEALLHWTATLDLSVPATLTNTETLETSRQEASGPRAELSGTGPAILELQIECLSTDACIPSNPVVIEGALVITSSNAVNAPQSIPIEYDVTDVTQALVIDKTALQFSAKRGSTNTLTDTITLTNRGASALNWGSASPYVNDQFENNADFHPPLPSWLTLSPSQGTLPAGGSVDIVVAINTANAAFAEAGTYNATIALDDDPGDSPPAVVGVVVKIVAGQVALTPATTFAAPVTTTAAQGAVATHPFTVSNPAPGDSPITFTPRVVMNIGSGWLRVVPAGAVTVQPGESATFDVETDAAGLAPGDYTGQVIIEDLTARNLSQTLFVALHVNAAGIRTVTPSTVTEHVIYGSTTPILSAATVGNANSTPFAFTSEVSAGAPWLTIVGPSSGSGVVLGAPASLQLNIDPTGLAVGTYTGTVTVTAPTAGNPPQSVTVTLVVSPAGVLIVTPSTVTEHANVGSTTPILSAATVGNANSTPIDFTSEVVAGAPWLTIVGASSGSGVVLGTPSLLQLRMDPTGLAIGTYTGTITVTAPTAGNPSQSITVTLHVAAVNAPPVAIGGTLTTNEDTAASSSVSATDPNGDTVSFTVTTLPAHGVLNFNSATGAYTYTPATNYSGSDSFAFSASDGLLSSNASVAITVIPVNDPPVAANDSATTALNTAVTVNVLANDSDIEGGALTPALVTGAAHGTVTPVPGGFLYTPTTGYSGPDSFTYRVNDGSANSNVATVNITVTGGTNRAPVAVNDSYSGQWNTPLTVAPNGVLANDTDADGNTLTAIKLTNPSQGTVTFNANGGFTYMPVANFSGYVSFTYKANDGLVDSNVATVSLRILSPCSRDDDRDNDDRDGRLGDRDDRGRGNDDHDRGRNGHHDGDGCERDRENHKRDRRGREDADWDDCRAGTPMAHTDSYATYKNTPLTVSASTGVLKNDGLYAKVAQLFSNPAHGTVTLAADGSFLYTPTLNFVGTDTFTYVPRSATNVAGAVTTVTISIKTVSWRMTGGGSVYTTAGARVTHGFELHCDVTALPNNIEVNWGKSDRFKLDKVLSARCFDDPAIAAKPPVVPFDTYVGTGIGSYNGKPGATITWTFTDAGEPGKNDSATMVIKDASGRVVLTVSGNLKSGNQQAHAGGDGDDSCFGDHDGDGDHDANDESRHRPKYDRD